MNKELEDIKNKVSEYYGMSCYGDITKSDMLKLETYVYDKVKQALTPITLDKDIEEVIDDLKDFFILDNARMVVKVERLEEHIQAQQSKLDKIDEVVEEMENPPPNTFIPKHIYVKKFKQIIGDE